MYQRGPFRDTTFELTLGGSSGGLRVVVVDGSSGMNSDSRRL